MELRTLRAFVEVVRQGGFSQAAKMINATQPTVSKAVRQLEDELGVSLLDRVGHRSSLTQAGDIVYRRARTILAEREDLVAELDALRGLKRGVLKIGLPFLGSSTLFAPLFATYRSRYPGIEINLVEHGSKQLEAILMGGDIELAATLLPVADDFAWQAIRREPLDVLLPVGHPLAAAERVPLEALAEEPFILFEGGFALNDVILKACARAGFNPRETARTGQTDFLTALVAAGLGIGFLPRMIALQRPHPAVRAVPLDALGTDWHMALVWRRGGYLSDAAEAWRALTREVYAAEDPCPGL